MTLAFVFGAGGSRGALQAGALEILLEAGLRPDLVTGSSIGAINAAFFAQDPQLDAVQKLQALYRRTDFTDLFMQDGLSVIKNVVTGSEHLFANEPMRDLLQENLSPSRFSDLALPCYVAATAVDTGALHVFGMEPNDDLLAGVMSSAALIPLYEPVTVNGCDYADGGLRAALPVQIAIDQGATTVIALNLTTGLQTEAERKTTLHMLFHALDLMMLGQVDLTRQLLEARQQAVVHIIDLAAEDYRMLLDLSDVESLIETGRAQTRQALAAIDLHRLRAAADS